MLVSCGGSKPTKQATVSLGPLDDFFTVKSYTIESDSEEKGLEKLDKVKGTLTIVVKRNETEMKFVMRLLRGGRRAVVRGSF